MKIPAEKIVIALDTASAKDATAMAKILGGTGVKFKIGMELFYAKGHGIVEKIAKHGAVFLDLKLHDIPETMAKAAAVITKIGVWMFNVHASAGVIALKTVHDRVTETASRENITKPLLIAVTVLTSLNNLKHLGADASAGDIAFALAKISHEAKCDGVVCSPRETSLIKTLGKDFLCVTPGIRRPTDPVDDQARTATPAEAIANGSDYIVIGRPVTKAQDPLNALQEIMKSQI